MPVIVPLCVCKASALVAASVARAGAMRPCATEHVCKRRPYSKCGAGRHHLTFRRWQNLEAGLSLDDEHAVEVRFVVKFKDAEEVQAALKALKLTSPDA